MSEGAGERIAREALAALERGALDVFAAAREAPARLALVEGSVELDHAELADEVRGELETFRELAPGAPVAFVARADRRTVRRIHAALASGRTALPLHPRLPEAQRASLVAQLEGAVLLDDEGEGGESSSARAAARRQDAPDARGAVGAGSRSVAGLRATAGAPLDPESIALCLATSGSTGAPKLVRLSRRALAASLVASERNLGWGQGDRWLVAMPLGHAGGVSILLRCLAARHAVVLHDGFDPARVIAGVAREGITMLSVVPTMLAALLEADRQGALAALRVVLVGGAACPAELLAEARRRGLPAIATYGLTEAGSQVATQPLGEAREARLARGDSGRPLQGFELRLGEASGRGEGVVELRGPALCSGYVGEAAPAPGAWWRTSDLGRLDDEGRLWILGRVDDVILSGGENVHPMRVEEVCSRAPSVAAALVFGVPDARWGQVVAAALVLRRGADEAGALAELAELWATQLGSYERPRRVAWVSELPLGATGKPDRRRASRELAGALVPIGR